MGISQFKRNFDAYLFFKHREVENEIKKGTETCPIVLEKPLFPKNKGGHAGKYN